MELRTDVPTHHATTYIHGIFFLFLLTDKEATQRHKRGKKTDRSDTSLGVSVQEEAHFFFQRGLRDRSIEKQETRPKAHIISVFLSIKLSVYLSAQLFPKYRLSSLQTENMV